MTFIGAIPDDYTGPLAPIAPPPPPPPAAPPPPVPDSTAYFLLNPVVPPPPPPPPVPLVVQPSPPPDLSGFGGQLTGVVVGGQVTTIPDVIQNAPPPGQIVPPPPPGDDLAAIAALVNATPDDTSPLPDWLLEDPFGLVELSTESSPTKGAAALAAIIAGCDLYGIDVKAACADGLHEGFGGGIGDGGTAFGPWQEHLLDGRIASFVGKPLSSPTVQAWAWSVNGIQHGIRGMAVDHPSARRLTGHAAVYAIVYGFERPLDKPAAYRTRRDEYDHLVSLGAGWQAYVIDRLAGAQITTSATIGGVQTAPIVPVNPAGVHATWRGLMAELGEAVPTVGVFGHMVAARLPGY